MSLDRLGKTGTTAANISISVNFMAICYIRCLIELTVPLHKTITKTNRNYQHIKKLAKKYRLCFPTTNNCTKNTLDLFSCSRSDRRYNVDEMEKNEQLLNSVWETKSVLLSIQGYLLTIS